MTANFLFGGSTPEPPGRYRNRIGTAIALRWGDLALEVTVNNPNLCPDMSMNLPITTFQNSRDVEDLLAYRLHRGR
jgi:hypothetical protein